MPHQRERNALPSTTAQRTAYSNTYRLAIKFAYDGTEFKGFQSQPHGHTIQDQLENKLKSRLQRQSLRIFAWGRTDSGVHAKGAVCTVDLTQDEIKRLAQGGERRRRQIMQGTNKNTTTLTPDSDESMTVPTTTTTTTASTNDDATNTDDTEDDPEQQTIMLQAAASTLCNALQEFTCTPGQPGSISARTCIPVPNDFDARFSSRWKRYVYYIVCGAPHRSPLLSRYAWQMSTVLDVSAMKQAVNLLHGRHAFHWLAVRQPGDLLHPIRDLQLTLDEQPLLGRQSMAGPCFFDCDEDTGTFITISATCDFFLYRLVRRIVGLVVAIGKGQVSIQQLESCLTAHDKDQELAQEQEQAPETLAATEQKEGSSPVVVAAGTKTKIPIPPELLHTAPPNGLFLDHIEYNIPI